MSDVHDIMQECAVPISKRRTKPVFEWPKCFRSGKYPNGREVYAVRLFRVRLGKHEVTLSWSSLPAYRWVLKTWLCFGMFGFHSFEFRVWFITVLGLTIRYELDCSDDVPDNLRGFIASRDSLERLEQYAKESEEG